jgi:hypothetical protein
MALFVVNINEHVNAQIHADYDSKILTVCSIDVAVGANYRVRVRDMIDAFVRVLSSQFPDYRIDETVKCAQRV